MLKLDWGDAQIWMDTAEMLYLQNAKNPGEFFPRADYPRMNELNVANVCAGYAFELIFKVLARAGGKQPEPVHKPSVAYGCLEQEGKDLVNRIVVDHGWNNPDELLEFLDEELCHRDRKYWMRPPKGGKARGTFHSGGRKGLDALKRLHKELSKLAIKRIEDNQDGYEDWSGTDQRL